MIHKLKEQIAKAIQDEWGNTCDCQACKNHYKNAANAVSIKIIAYFEDHYWDSLEYNKDIVILHVQTMLGVEK